jgi:hypothetical protein
MCGGSGQTICAVEQERSLLHPLREEARTGRLVTARSLKIRYETRVGHVVPDSTVYRLLARHQWRPWQLDTRTGPCA